MERTHSDTGQPGPVALLAFFSTMFPVGCGGSMVDTLAGYGDVFAFLALVDFCLLSLSTIKRRSNFFDEGCSGLNKNGPIGARKLTHCVAARCSH